MQIIHSLHAAILVSNLEQAEHFYGTVLGLSKVDRVLKYPGAWYEIAGFQIHLIVTEAGAENLQNPEKLGRNRHIAFSVIDIEAAKNHLLAHDRPVQISASGRAALFTQDLDGNVIELSQA